MIGDAIFAILFGVIYYFEMTIRPGYYSFVRLTSYASVTTLFYM
jgi:hypothetical protein